MPSRNPHSFAKRQRELKKKKKAEEKLAKKALRRQGGVDQEAVEGEETLEGAEDTTVAQEHAEDHDRDAESGGPAAGSAGDESTTDPTTRRATDLLD